MHLFYRMKQAYLKLEMSTKLSRKRATDMSDEILPKKTVPEVLDSINHDVTIIVDGQRFQCQKEVSCWELSGI